MGDNMKIYKEAYKIIYGYSLPEENATEENAKIFLDAYKTGLKMLFTDEEAKLFALNSVPLPDEKMKEFEEKFNSLREADVKPPD